MVPIIASVTPNKTKFGPLLYPGELAKAIRELSELSYDGIELSLRTAQDINQKELEKQLKESNLKLVSIATGQSYVEDGYSLFHHDAEFRKKTEDRIKQFVDIIVNFGAKAVILGGIRGKLDQPDKDKQFNGGLETIERCLEYAGKNNVTLLLEAINRYETNLLNTVDSCVEVAKKFKSEYLKVLGDSFHMNIEEISLKGALDEAAEYIGAIHCADSNRLAPGMGHVNFKEMLSDIEKYPYLIYLGVEVLPLPDSRASAETAIKTLHKITR
ncbi:MAG: sugar phosphate isomerase/epimerase family protein [Sphaerochaetaceae bacterium]